MADIRIIRDYLPPFPGEGTQTKRFVVYDADSGTFLRHSKGPQQGHFWDTISGDDYLTLEFAQRALQEAPPPHRVEWFEPKKHWRELGRCDATHIAEGQRQYEAKRKEEPEK